MLVLFKRADVYFTLFNNNRYYTNKKLFIFKFEIKDSSLVSSLTKYYEILAYLLFEITCMNILML